MMPAQSEVIMQSEVIQPYHVFATKSRDKFINGDSEIRAITAWRDVCYERMCARVNVSHKWKFTQEFDRVNLFLLQHELNRVK